MNYLIDKKILLFIYLSSRYYTIRKQNHLPTTVCLIQFVGMVWPVVLLKVFPCKKYSRKRHPTIKDIGSRGTSNSRGRLTLNIQNDQGVSSTIKHKKEAYSKGKSNSPTRDRHTVMKEQEKAICRVCLKEGDIPIFDKSKSDNIPVALATFGGIEIEEDDAYPKYLCSYCHAFLQRAFLFRKTAQKSDKILRNPPEFKRVNLAEQYTRTGRLMVTRHIRKEEESKQDDNVDNLIDDEECDNETTIAPEYHCKRCDMHFKLLREYQEHVLLTKVHKSEKRTSCPLCDKSFSVSYIKKHLELHNLKTPQSICDICGKTFSVKNQMKRHRATHFMELPHKCDQCPYRGRFIGCLKAHMRQHTGEKPYQCPICLFRVSNRSNLNKHMLSHKEKHDYTCDMCGRGFHTKRTLEMHLKIVHTGIKDHICNICGNAFGYRSQLMKHQLKVHKREKKSQGRLPLYLQVEKATDNGESET